MDGHQRMAATLHVAYELRQMVGAALRLDDAQDDVTGNALLESTLLHVRTLSEFLIGPGRGSDIRATDLAPGWVIDPAARPGLEDRLRALHKHLAHLTVERLDGTQRWPYPQIVREIVEHMRAYHQTMVKAGVPFAATIGDELERIDTVARPRWTTETTGPSFTDLDTATSTPGWISVTQMRDPLKLSGFDTEG